jgi:glucuronate isomerase
MTSFITEDFLLHSEFAKRLYHHYAKDLPIIDYHCHLSPKDIAENRVFKNLTEIWLEGDHYKWRAMRTLGIDEKYITGNASPSEKFDKWAYAVPYTLRNPLYHWTHLELSRYFHIHDLLTPDTAHAIYKKGSDQLSRNEYHTRGLLRRMKVEVIGTTDDPTDTLAFHQKIKNDGVEVKVVPSFRPDKSFAVESPKAYKDYIGTLSEASGISIKNFDDLLQALKNRIEFFHQHGCRLSDHGLEHLYFHDDHSVYHPSALFGKLMEEIELSKPEREYFKYAVLTELCKLYHQHGWTQQFHLGAIRNTNRRKLRDLGPDTGFDSIGDFQQSVSMVKFLNELDETNQLAKTIIYNLNPSDNEVIATMTGNFNDGPVKGKIQFGSAWWFLDQKDGMEKQLNALSNLSLLSCFIGMLTDSRSFLSYPRHEYFRRILCNMIGNDVKNGELPWDEKWLGKVVGDVCYNNAREYFKF